MTRSRSRKILRPTPERTRPPAARPGRPGLPLAGLMLGALPAVAQEQEGLALQEVIVTAQKRSENLQSVPVSIQALDGGRLQELQVADFKDYAQYLPSLSYQTFGPGQAQLYVRGVTNGGDGLHVGSQPLVGVYLDELPVTTIANALDVHIYDVQRVEALSGPQGTLYGASSMAGTLRIITNKPNTNSFSGGYDATWIGSGRGGNGGKLEGFVNIPLNDRAAIRLVGWSERDPGYIDNVAGPAAVYPTSGIPRDNTGLRGRNFNDTSTTGARGALKLDLNDSWTITPSVIWQNQAAHGSYAYEPALGDLKVAQYFPDRNDDHWYQAALTVQGRVWNLDFVYSGGYFEREVRNLTDYSDYSYFYDTHYHAAGSAPIWFTFNDNAGNPINPAQYQYSTDRYTKLTQEMRIASPAEWPLRFVAGLFLQHQTDNSLNQYRVPGLADALSVTGQPGVHYENSQWRVDRDRAAFGELTYDVSAKLAVTAGARVFDYDNTVYGFFGYGSLISQPGGSAGEGYCFAPSPGGYSPCININDRTRHGRYTWKGNVSYKIDPDRMVYFTASTGFRPGGVNRVHNYPSYAPDFLTNYEAGWKTTWLAHRLRFNGALFWEEWKDGQFGISGPNAITVIVNAGRARIRGIESDVEWAATERLTLSASGTYLNAKTLDNSCAQVDPTFTCTSPAGNSVLAPVGTRLPVSPRLKMNAIARYESPLGSFKGHAQLAGVYQSNAIPALKVADARIIGTQPGFFSLDFAAGLARSNWTAEAYVDNLLDRRGQVIRYTGCIPATCSNVYVIPTQPLSFGVRFGQRF